MGTHYSTGVSDRYRGQIVPYEHAVGTLLVVIGAVIALLLPSSQDRKLHLGIEARVSPEVFEQGSNAPQETTQRFR
jgi:hypothetical protein